MEIDRRRKTVDTESKGLETGRERDIVIAQPFISIPNGPKFILNDF